MEKNIATQPATPPTPEITGALLSSMLLSMNELGGNLGTRLLAQNGVVDIDATKWYPRQVQHNCFVELDKRLGERALSFVGFSIVQLKRSQAKERIQEITERITGLLSQSLGTEKKLDAVTDAAGELIRLSNSGAQDHVRNHPADYGFRFRKIDFQSCQVSFSSFPIPSITPCCKASIYTMIRLGLPPQVQMHISPNHALPNRAAGASSDTFDIRFELVSTDLTLQEMHLLETLKFREALLHAAIEETERAREKASLALAQHMESVNYASRIQRGLLAPRNALDRRFKSQAVLWEPRDLIGGDIYWMTPSNDEDFSVALVDCTGHGVPGALLSMLVSSTLERVYQIDPTIDPGVALAQLGDLIRGLLKQDRPDAQSRDGFDAAICRVNKQRGEIVFSSARIGLFIIPSQPGQGTVQRIPGEQHSLGYTGTTPHSVLTTHTIPFQPDDVFILISDGIIDQIGQNRDIAFGYRRLTDTLTQCIGKTAQGTIDHLHQTLTAWQGTQPRRDDISAFAFTL